MLRLVATGTISQSGSRFILKKLRLYVIHALFVGITRLVVFVFEGFFSGDGYSFQRFLVVIVAVTTDCLGFPRVLF